MGPERKGPSRQAEGCLGFGGARPCSADSRNGAAPSGAPCCGGLRRRGIVTSHGDSPTGRVRGGRSVAPSWRLPPDATPPAAPRDQRTLYRGQRDAMQPQPAQPSRSLVAKPLSSQGPPRPHSDSALQGGTFCERSMGRPHIENSSKNSM